MNKREKQKIVFQKIAAGIEHVLTTITYVVLLIVSGFTTWFFSVLTFQTMFNQDIVLLTIGNFLIFGILFYSWFHYNDNVK